MPLPTLGKELELHVPQVQRRAGHYPEKLAALPEGQASTVLSSVPFPLPSIPAISGQAFQLPFMQLMFRPGCQSTIPSPAPTCMFFLLPTSSFHQFVALPHARAPYFFIFFFKLPTSFPPRYHFPALKQISAPEQALLYTASLTSARLRKAKSLVKARQSSAHHFLQRWKFSSIVLAMK